MRRRRPTLAAITAGMALLALLPAPCPCPEGPASPAEHACCAPPDGVRAADHGCCMAAADVAREAVAVPSLTDAVGPALLSVTWVTPPAAPVLDRGPVSPEPAVSPPLSVRRL